MASLQRHAPPWAQTTIGILMATLWACAPPPEHELAPTLGSGPPLADTGDSPADDPEDDDPEEDDPEDDEGDAPEDDAASSSGGSESGDETSGTSGSGEPCPPADEGCACTLDGRCGEGLSCVDGTCEPCDGCEPPSDPCAESDTGACEGEDPCASGMYGDGPYCGESIGGTAETLYLCAGGATTATSACDFGCAQCDPFESDVCKSFAGQQDAAACE